MNRRYIIKATIAAAFAALFVRPAQAASADSVAIQGFKFKPASLDMNVGDKIEFTNNDSAPHSATAKDDSWDTGTIDRGQSKTITVKAGMGDDFKCSFHPAMKGKLTIKA
jgi:plastocyanin